MSSSGGGDAGLRVVSLMPSVTETLRAWGRDPVACTRFCEQPDLVHVGGTKDPDVPAIVALRPDLVVVDEEENRLEDADALTAAGIPLFITAVRSIADVAPTLARLAHAVGVVVPDERLPEAAPKQGSAFVPIWRRPWMTINGNTYGSSLLATLGFDNVYREAAERYPTVELVDVASLGADRVLAPSEPYPFAERHREELETVAPVAFIDGRDLFWWGARTADAVARLAAVLDRLRKGGPAR